MEGTHQTKKFKKGTRTLTDTKKGQQRRKRPFLVSLGSVPKKQNKNTLFPLVCRRPSAVIVTAVTNDHHRHTVDPTGSKVFGARKKQKTNTHTTLLFVFCSSFNISRLALIICSCTKAQGHLYKTANHRKLSTGIYTRKDRSVRGIHC